MNAKLNAILAIGAAALCVQTLGAAAWSVTENRGDDAGVGRPTGAGTFEIERPRASSGPVVKAADYGFSPTNDLNAAAITRALKAASELHASRLELAPGTYNCFDDKGIVARGLRDFTFDGKGALLVFRRPSSVGGAANFTIEGTERCVFRDLKMDWDWERDPLASLGTCVGKHLDEQNDDASYFDMKLDRTPPCYPETPTLQTATTIDAERQHLIGTPPNRLVFLGNAKGPKSAWISKDTLRIWPGVKPSPDAQVAACYHCYYNPQINRETVRQIPVGISYRLLHYYYGMGAFNLNGNRHFTLENVDIWSCRGFGIGVGGAQQYWQVVNVNLAPPAEKLSSRLTSSTADGHHVSRSLGWCKYINFGISFCNDDSHNFHDCMAYGVAEKPNRLRITFPKGLAYLAPKVGNVIELHENNYDPTGWSGKIVKIEGPVLEMDRDVPQPKGDRFLFFNRSVATDHILMKGCVCRDSHFRNLFQSNDLTLEDCVFERMGSGAVQIGADWTHDLWCEGMGVTNCVIRNCLFRDGNQQTRGRDDGWAAEFCSFLGIPGDVKHAKPTPGFLSDILVENCRFENTAGLLANLVHVKNFTFRKNQITDEGALPNRSPRTGGFHFRNCRGVSITDNTWQFAAGLPAPSVTCDDDCRGVSTHGNTLRQDPLVELPGEKGGPKALDPAPFPDRMSKFVWRNWFVVPHERLAAVVGAKVGDLEQLAVQMGLPREVDVLSKWHRKGYITVLRRNWHLLDYPQLLKLLEMTRKQLRFALMEEDFLWIKLGSLKPACGPLTWDAKCLTDPAAVQARKRGATILKEEGIDDFTEEPRFAFIDDLKQVDPGLSVRTDGHSPFDMRLIFSYFADYMDPLADPAVSSFPEGLLQKLAAQGVNAVWMHTVLSTLARDPRYPEFGMGSEDRMNNLRTLVARAAKYGIRIYLYMNEPRAQPSAFFAARPERAGMKGVTQGNEGTFTMCTSSPETLRWMRDAIYSVFKAVPGLGGIFTITMSENNTNCASRGLRHNCPRCKSRSVAEIVSEVNATLIDGMRAANPQAEALVWNWGWPTAENKEILSRLPKKGCRVMAVSEGLMDINRGGVHVVTADYSISVVGPGEPARTFWADARKLGVGKTAAKVQANTTWEIATVPYLPTMDLVAEHASNLVKSGVDGVMLSWSLGCAPAPNLRVFNEIGKDGDVGRTLDHLATDIYGVSAREAVRKAWTSFSEGFRNYPFSCAGVYNGPHQWGPVNPLFPKPTSYNATMVGFPYDDVKRWCASYPDKIWVELMQKVADGFEKGCAEWKEVIAAVGDDGKRELARREYGLFRTAGLHFASCADQVRFVWSRDAGDAAQMREITRRELARAKEELEYVRADSRLGYESSNHYYFIPQDIREKIIGCRLILEGQGKEGQ